MAGKQFSVEKFMGTLAPVSDSDTQWIAVERIINNPLNFYPRPTNEALGHLMESIQANGLLEPPTVVRDGEQYRLISGHSRMEAVRLLHSQAPEDTRWASVLCRILPPMNREQEASAVIEANRQRVKSPALLSQEAEKLTDLYIRRKKNGEELPGRIRDRVAEALQVNATKLANLSAIKNGIKVPGILRHWEQGDIPEAAALEIARMDQEAQYRLLDWMIDKGRHYTIGEVRMFRAIWICCLHDCPLHGGLCPNAETMYRSHFRGGYWDCPGCCRSCLRRDTCPQSCCKPAQSSEGDPSPEKTSKNPMAEDPRLDWHAMVPEFCSRVKTLRERTGLSKKDFAESIGEHQATYSAWENASLAGSGSVPKLALCLGTSTDYLYGLTDDPAPKSGPEWQPLDREHWPAERQLVLLTGETGLGGQTYVAAWCVGAPGDRYPFEEAECGTELDEPSNGAYDGYWWMPLQEKGANHD